MKYQKTFLNIVIIFFLFFTLFVQAEDKLQEEKEQIDNYGHALVTGIEASSHSALYNEQISIKLGELIKSREIANGLDRLINVVKVFGSAYNHDIYSTTKNIIDAHASTYIAGATSALAMGAIGLFTVSPPVAIGGGIIAGIGTAVAYTEIDPVERIIDAKDYALGIKYPYHKRYNNAVASLLSCDLNNANKQINLATKDRLMLLGKSKAKCISIKAKRLDYMRKNNIKGFNSKDTVFGSQQSVEMIRFEGNLKSAENEKKEHSDFLVKILKFEKDLRKKNENLNSLMADNRKELDFIRNTSSVQAACIQYNAHIKYNADVAEFQLSKCEKTFMETSMPSLMDEKTKLMIEMNNNNRLMSSDRWNFLDNFRKPGSCSSLDNDLEKLLDFEKETLQKPIYTFTDSSCTPQDQSNFFTEVKAEILEIVEKKRKCREEKKAEEKKAEEEKKDLAIADANCQDKRPGSTPDYHRDTGNVDCICKEPLVLNNEQSECITKDDAKQEKKDIEIAEKKCEHNLVAVWNEEIGEPKCVCLGPVFVWNKAKDECIPQDSKLLATYCDIKLPGSVPEKEDCVCPEGREKSEELNMCVEISDVNKTVSSDKKKSEKETSATESPNYSQCPKQNPGNKLSNKFDTNNDPKDDTYIKCNYFKDGVLRYQAAFKNGKKHGVVLSRAEKKAPHRFLILETYKDGVKNGIQIKWRIEQGHYYKATEYKYKEGELDGVSIKRKINRKTGRDYIWTEIKFAKGKKILYTVWYDNGVKLSISTYSNNGRDRREKKFNKKGKPTYCTEYKHNKLPRDCDTGYVQPY